uniref:Uncharacterized protein n=1 Tax=Panagrellus redivivus TaxID=6233 RepID=A0A7E4ULL8_PANRE
MIVLPEAFFTSDSNAVHNATSQGRAIVVVTQMADAATARPNEEEGLSVVLHLRSPGGFHGTSKPHTRFQFFLPVGARFERYHFLCLSTTDRATPMQPLHMQSDDDGVDGQVSLPSSGRRVKSIQRVSQNRRSPFGSERWLKKTSDAGPKIAFKRSRAHATSPSRPKAISQHTGPTLLLRAVNEQKNSISIVR